MPYMIEHIDAIARRKQRDALFVTFYNAPSGERSPYHWEAHPARAAIIAWLDDHGYGWNLCGEVASERVMRSYRGSIYIDLPFDRDNLAYRELEAFLEFVDGSLRFPHMRFLVIDLEHAQENAHHDEPGFWERWADGF